MTEHSPEAKTAYPDPIAPWDSAEALREVEISRTAFDRGRESALADLAALREHPFVGIGFESGTTFALTGENVGHWVEGSPTHVPLAERQTTDRETLVETIRDVLRRGLYDMGDGLPYESQARVVADTLLASGLVKDSGDEWIPCGRGICAAKDGHEGTCAEASGWDDEDEL